MNSSKPQPLPDAPPALEPAAGVEVKELGETLTIGKQKYDELAKAAREYGTVIAGEDIAKLKRMGVREIFTPGASLEAIVNFVQSIGIKTPKARRSKQEPIPSFAAPARVGGKSRSQAKQKSRA